MAKKPTAKAAVKVAAASGTASGTLDPSRRDAANKIAAAMVESDRAAMAKGITDPEKLLKLKLAARDKAAKGL